MAETIHSQPQFHAGRRTITNIPVRPHKEYFKEINKLDLKIYRKKPLGNMTGNLGGIILTC